MAVKLLGQVAEGSVVKIQEGGKAVEFYVAKHDYESELNGAGRTLVVRKEGYDRRDWTSTNVNAYASSDIDAWMNGDYKALLPEGIQTAMGTTKFYYTPGNGNNTVSTLNRAVFLLSMTELSGIHNNANTEGSALPIADTLQIVNYNGSPNAQSTRSPIINDTDSIIYFKADGTCVSIGCGATLVARPAFTLSATLYVWYDGSVSVEPQPEVSAPELAMQGQKLTVAWPVKDGAESYILLRKADTDADWVQVYTGAGLTFTETAGAWTNVQYRVQAVFGGVPGGWAQSAAIPVVSAAALVISGQDGDLGTIVNDVPYSVSSDGGSPLLVTVRVNGGLADSFTAENGKKNWIPVVDLPTGHGKIEIAAATGTESGTVNVARSWTYTKTAQAFGDAGGVADLSLNGQTMWPKTISEAVRTPGVWGGNLGTALNLLKNAALYSRTRQPKYTEVKVDLSKAKEGDVVNLPEGGVMIPFYVAKLDYEEELNGAGRTLLVRKEVYDFRQWHSAKINAYASSDIDVWMNGDYKNMLDPSIQEAMGTTKIRYTPGNGDWTVSTLERAVFSLSPTELGISHDQTNMDGSALPIANTLKIANYKGTASSQWTRSPNQKNSEYVFLLGQKGDLTNGYSFNTNGARPAFTLPADFSTGTYLVDTNGAIKAEQEYTQGGDFSDIWGKTIPVPKIAAGSYVGTGTHGKDNPNTLTFPFEPKLVVIQHHRLGDSYSLYMLYGVETTSGNYHESNGTVKITWNSKTVSWYANLNDPQMNVSGETYHYFALG